MFTWTRPCLLVVSFLCALWPLASSGQAYPEHGRSIRIVVPFGAGSGTDACARIIANSLQSALDTNVVVENKPGALGTIAASQVARAPADGYTLLLTTATTQSAAKGLFKNLAYDPDADFTPIARLGNIPSVVLVNPDLPVRSIDDLSRYIESNPGKVSYATGNSTGVIAGGALMHYGNFEMTHIPYNSVSHAMPDFLAGRVEVLMADFVTAFPRIQSGAARAIAVPSKQRVVKLPEVPAIAETAGFEQFDLTAWLGVFAPASVPQPVVDKLSIELQRIVNDPATREQLDNIGIEAFTTSLPEFRDFVRAEADKWQREIRNAKIEPR